KISLEKIKKLREKSGSGIMEVKKALMEAKGEVKKAEKILKKMGLKKISKRKSKETGEGRVYAYVHSGGSVGALVRVLCETDFVANSDGFVNLCKELAMQVASMKPKNVKELLGQKYIRDQKKLIKDLVEEEAICFKEKIVVKDIARLEL
ncbi:MAG: elongation factor Ts, partial [Patescibacteria group bacterium]|nr:elongation factor Ts [Patescibacteria group bacterium]